MKLEIKERRFYDSIVGYNNEYQITTAHELTEKGIELWRELKEIRNYPKNLIK